MTTKKKKKNGIRVFFITIIITLCIIAIYSKHSRFLEVIELKFFDLRFRFRENISSDSNIIIAAVDQKSIDELGRWPWPRNKIKSLIKTLSDAGAKTIAFDIIFSSPEKNILAESLEEYSNAFPKIADQKQIQKYINRINPDRDLSRAIEEAGNVILGMFFFLSPQEVIKRGKQIVNQDAEFLVSQRYPLIQQLSPSRSENRVAEGYGFESSLEILAKSAKGNGFFNMYPDFDGVIRWTPLIIKYMGNYYPSLTMQIVKDYLDIEDDSVLIQMGANGVESLYLEDMPIPVDERGNLLINYRGSSETFPQYSISDILNHKVPMERLQDKIILIGATATSIYDMRYTPYKIMAGVEIHANILNNILNQDFLSIPKNYFLLEVLILFCIGLLLGILLPLTRPMIGTLVTISILIGYIYLNFHLLLSKGIWINLVYPTIEILSIFTIVNLYRYSTEEREKKNIKKTFEHYLAPAMVKELINNPERLRLGGEKKVLTVLFSDIRGFTTISERLKPETLISLLNEYLTTMSTIILDNFGFLDKFIGDAIMAVYCTPITREDHALLSCQTALDMQIALKEINKKFKQEHLIEIKIGIGINSGEMVIGNVGSKQRFDYTVLGDNVNLASRLEGITKLFGVEIIISEFTYQLIQDNWRVRELDIVRVKGKKRPVKIYELIGKIDDKSCFDSLFALYYEGLEAFRNRQFGLGLQKFQEALNLNPLDGPSQYYLKRCQQYKQQPPPPNWDTISTLLTK